jgi:hypothetical protein
MPALYANGEGAGPAKYRVPGYRDAVGAWFCRNAGEKFDVVQIPPQPGRSTDDLVLSHIVAYPPSDDVLRSQKADRVSRNTISYWKDIDPHRLDTWHTHELDTPGGQVTARFAEFWYTAKKTESAAGYWMVVEDPRQPGSLLACSPEGYSRARFQEDCAFVLTSMLKDDRW